MTNHKHIATMAWLVGLSLPLGCAEPCLDDGLVQQNCEANSANTDSASGTESASASASGTQGATESASASGSASGTGSGSATDTGTTVGLDDTGTTDLTRGTDATAGTVSASATDTDTDTDTDSASASASASTTSDSAGTTTGDTGGGALWCLDLDGDGFGDPDECTDMMGPGTVQNDGDCNDGDPNTYPGAAINEDIMLCTTDTDGDGWGDAVPAPGAAAGADCWPDNPDLSPTTLDGGSIDGTGLQDVAASFDPADGALSVIAPINTPLLGWLARGTALRHNGDILVADAVSGGLFQVDYDDVCTGMAAQGQATSLPGDLGPYSVCGLAVDADDQLWGVDTNSDLLLHLDPTTALVIESFPLSDGGGLLDISDCGLTWDCHTERLLLAHASAGQVRWVNRGTGETFLVAEYQAAVGVAAIDYDPIERVTYVSTGVQLNRVPLDGGAAVVVGNFNYGGLVADIANLAELPNCAP